MCQIVSKQSENKQYSRIWPSSFLFVCCFYGPQRSRENAKKKGLRLIISHLDRISLVNKRFIIKQKDFALLGINNAFCFESQERKPTVFFSTVNQGQSFMSSLPWLSSAFFFFLLLYRHCPKNYELCKSVVWVFFPTGDQSVQSQAGEKGPSPRVANQNKGVASYYPRAWKIFKQIQ